MSIQKPTPAESSPGAVLLELQQPFQIALFGLRAKRIAKPPADRPEYFAGALDVDFICSSMCPLICLSASSPHESRGEKTANLEIRR